MFHPPSTFSLLGVTVGVFLFFFGLLMVPVNTRFQDSHITNTIFGAVEDIFSMNCVFHYAFK